MQTPESILLSVLSLLGSPSDESPANIEAGKLVRQERVAEMGSRESKEFKRKTRRSARDSLGEE